MNRFIYILLILLCAATSLFYYSRVEYRELPTQKKQSNNVESISLPEIEESKSLPVSTLSKHFPDERTYVPVEETDEPFIEVVETREPTFTSEMKYVSSITRDKIKHYFFKNNRNGRIYELTLALETEPWSLLSVEEDHYLLKNEETLWKVRK